MNEPTSQPEQPPAIVLDAQAVKKVRDANIVNILRKVKSGKPLTPAEAKTVEESTVERAQWPVYDSIQQCATSSGWPIEVLRQCKKNGCPAFRSTRIYFGEIAPWFFAQKGEDQENWTKRDKRAAALLKETELEKQKERTITKDELSPVIIESMAVLYGSLQRFFVDDQPKKAQGMTEADIRALNQQFVNQAFADYKGKMLAKVEPPKQLIP